MIGAPTSWRTSSDFALKLQLRTAPSHHRWYLVNERWWRAIQTGVYCDWMKLQCGSVLKEPIA
jgi:hypothetical protein